MYRLKWCIAELCQYVVNLARRFEAKGLNASYNPAFLR